MMKVRQIITIFLAGWMSLIVWFVLPTSVPVPLQAQTEDAISGIVRDEQGPVMGAIVRVRATNQFAITDAEGRFTLAGLMPGEPVNLTAWASGYYIVGGEEYLPDRDDIELILASMRQDNPNYHGSALMPARVRKATARTATPIPIIHLHAALRRMEV
jgi:hypothetical protein